MRIELIFVPSSRAVSMAMCVYNGTVYIYSRISGEKRQKTEEILCFRLDTILWVFLCAHRGR